MIIKNGDLIAEINKNNAVHFFIEYKGAKRKIFCVFASDLSDAQEIANSYLANDGAMLWHFIEKSI